MSKNDLTRKVIYEFIEWMDANKDASGELKLTRFSNYITALQAIAGDGDLSPVERAEAQAVLDDADSLKFIHRAEAARTVAKIAADENSNEVTRTEAHRTLKEFSDRLPMPSKEKH